MHVLRVITVYLRKKEKVHAFLLLGKTKPLYNCMQFNRSPLNFCTENANFDDFFNRFSSILLQIPDGVPQIVQAPRPGDQITLRPTRLRAVVLRLQQSHRLECPA